MNKYCLIYNFAQHYRSGIFKELDSHFDFFFGDKINSGIEKLDYSLLSNFRTELKNIYLPIKPIYYQKGVINLVFKNYTSFLILGEYYCLSNWLFVLLARVRGKKVYMWTHGWYGNEGFIKSLIKKTFFNLSDGIFLYGEYAKRLMIERDFNGDRLHVIYNSLDYFQQIAIRSKISPTRILSSYFNNNYYNVIFIGRLTNAKKLDLALRALALLKDRGFGVNMVIVGSGPEQSNLRNIVKMLGLSVWFFGASYDERQVAEFIFNSDLCVSPGNVGLTAIHSLTYGTPVVTHNSFEMQGPEFESIEEGVTGSFFEQGNVLSLADCIQSWLSTKQSFREETRLECYKVVETKYNPKFQVKKILNIMNNE